MQIYIAMFLCLLFMGTAVAEETNVASVTYIGTWDTVVGVTVDAPYITQPSCPSHWAYNIDLINDPGAQAKLATLLSVFMTGKKVKLVISGCVGDAPKIAGIRLSSQ